MSRGDQRDRDRAKNQAKHAGKNTVQREGQPAERNADDATKLAAKVEAKKKKEAEEAIKAAASAGAPVIVPKKKAVAKKKDNFDDLLSAGLSTTKKRAK
jgi:homoserine dehydrogenase